MTRNANTSPDRAFVFCAAVRVSNPGPADQSAGGFSCFPLCPDVGRVPLGGHCFAYLITSCCRRSIPVDAWSLRRISDTPLSALGELLQSSLTEHVGPSEAGDSMPSGACPDSTGEETALVRRLARPILGKPWKLGGPEAAEGSHDRSDCVPHMWSLRPRGHTGFWRFCGSVIARLPAPAP